MIPIQIWIDSAAPSTDGRSWELSGSKEDEMSQNFSPPAGNTTFSSITFVITKYPFWPAPIQIDFCIEIVEGIRALWKAENYRRIAHQHRLGSPL